MKAESTESKQSRLFIKWNFYYGVVQRQKLCKIKVTSLMVFSLPPAFSHLHILDSALAVIDDCIFICNRWKFPRNVWHSRLVFQSAIRSGNNIWRLNENKVVKVEINFLCLHNFLAIEKGLLVVTIQLSEIFKALPKEPQWDWWWSTFGLVS